MAGEELVHSPRCLPVLPGRLQFQPRVNAANDQHVVFGFDFPEGLRYQTLVRCIDVTRFQRASESAGESTGGSGDDVVESGRVGIEHLRRNFVVLGNRAVHAEHHRIGFSREPRPAQRPAHAFDSHLGPIDDFRHKTPSPLLTVPQRNQK